MKIDLTITQVELIPFRPKHGHLGFASCVINDQFYLSDIAIFSRPQGGIRLGYPIKTLSNGITLDIFKPLNKEAEASIEAAITEKFESLHECNGKSQGFANGKHIT